MNTPSSPYQLQEGSILVPSHLTDRSINTFVHNDGGKIKFNITIARDTLEKGETLQTYVTRQIGLLKENMPSYKLTERGPAVLGSGGAAVAGEQLEATYKSGSKTVFQCQAAFIVAPGRAMVFSATSAIAFDNDFDPMWLGFLASFSPQPQ